MKQLVWPMEARPLREWEPEYLKAIAEWWDARPRRPLGPQDTGGLMSDEPRLFLGARLPGTHVKWTKDLRLLYRRTRAAAPDV